MGVPAFFKWLCEKYETSVALKFPSGEFDNLYLDMNGIIHPCTHPEDGAGPESEQEMFEAIFEYVELVYDLIKPKRMIYLAVDGVAPRAKMNQQRARRFKAAKESEENCLKKENAIKKLEARGIRVPEIKKSFDPNCITPGTEFMSRFCESLKTFVEEKCGKGKSWEKLTVVVSDSTVPGEGEHKIMEFVRKQKFRSGYDLNTSHVLVGADADLIMLGLASHENNFFILREEHRNKILKCEICRSEDHPMEHCFGIPVEAKKSPAPKFSLVSLKILRDLLKEKFGLSNFDKVLDDWVFLCFLVGNDFLPNIPGLEIRQGGLDLLFEIYKECVEEENEFFTDSGRVNFRQLKILSEKLSSRIRKIQPGYFKKKFGQDSKEFRTRVAVEYAKGLNWVLLYYYQGCPSWNWYYPFHYAPTAQDLASVSDMDEVVFEIGSPVEPFEQLLSIFPIGSRAHIPDPYAELMFSSSLKEFFPEKFSCDLNGKKFQWQAVVLLPFVDRDLLVSETEKKKHLLTEKEAERNRIGKEYISIGEWVPQGDISGKFFSNPKFPRNFIFKSIGVSSRV